MINLKIADAAAHPYACLCLYHVMEAKREALNPVPPRPAHAEFNLPILLADGDPVPVPTRNDSQEPEENETPVEESAPKGEEKEKLHAG